MAETRLTKRTAEQFLADEVYAVARRVDLNDFTKLDDDAAESLLDLPHLDDARRIQLVVTAAFGRPPTGSESESLLVFVGSENDDKTPRKQKWSQLIQALFGSVDFRYVR